MSDFLSGLSGYIWGNNLFEVTGLLVPLLLGVGILLTIVFRGFQFRYLGAALHLALIKRNEDTEEGDISHYRALTTALSGTLGTGNIGGVGAAILIGGPGALFWMWVTAYLVWQRSMPRLCWVLSTVRKMRWENRLVVLCST